MAVCLRNFFLARTDVGTLKAQQTEQQVKASWGIHQVRSFSLVTCRIHAAMRFGLDRTH